MNAITTCFTVALVAGPSPPECFEKIRRSSDLHAFEFRTGRQALRVRGAIDAWVVSDQLPDMRGVTCVELLSQIHDESRFFVVAESFNRTDESHCFQLPSTKYLCPSMAWHWLRQLLRAQARWKLVEGGCHPAAITWAKARHTSSAPVGAVEPN